MASKRVEAAVKAASYFVVTKAEIEAIPEYRAPVRRKIPKAPPPSVAWDGTPMGRPRFSTHPRAEYWREYKRKKYHEKKRGAT